MELPRIFLSEDLKTVLEFGHLSILPSQSQKLSTTSTSIIILHSGIRFDSTTSQNKTANRITTGHVAIVGETRVALEYDLEEGVRIDMDGTTDEIAVVLRPEWIKNIMDITYNMSSFDFQLDAVSLLLFIF